MGAWARTLLLALAAFLLLGRPVLSAAEDEEDEEEPELAGDPSEHVEEPPPEHSDEEWEAVKKNIMDSLPDDEEQEEESTETPGRWHLTGGFPFIEYSGFLAKDELRDPKKMDLHSGKMTLEDAKEWCAKESKCVGFHHAGPAGDGPFEFTFKDYWKLSVETEDEWTSYQKGDPAIGEVEGEEEPTEPIDISAEDIMKEYGVEDAHAEL